METPPPIFDEDAYYERIDIRNQRDFIGYRLLVETVLRKGKGLMNTRAIHIALGVHAVPRWTLLALEESKHVILFPGYPTDRFLWFDGIVPEVKKVEWNGCHVLSGPKKVNADLGLEGRVLA